MDIEIQQRLGTGFFRITRPPFVGNFLCFKVSLYIGRENGQIEGVEMDLKRGKVNIYGGEKVL